MREEFGGRGPAELFAEFSPEPVASASIGQVHRARLHSGEQVAVKVQYPDIEEIVRIDLQALRRIFRVAALVHARLRVRQHLPRDQRDGASPSSTSGARRRRSRRSRPTSPRATSQNVRFPRVIAECSTGRVLTTEWMEGTKVAHLERLDSQKIDRRAAARACVEAYCEQIFIDGLYHADPHPGNLLVQTPPPGITRAADGRVPGLRRDRAR